MELDLLLILFFCFLVFLANGVETVAGFGGMVIALSAGAQLMPLPLLVAALLPVNFALSIYILAAGVRHVQVGVLLRELLPGAAIGFVPGLLLARHMEGAWLLRSFGLLVAALALWQLAALLGQTRYRSLLGRLATPQAAADVHSKTQLAHRLFFFALGGFIHAIYLTGGVFMVYGLSRRVEDKMAFRTTLAALWVLLNTIMVSKMGYQGAFTADSLKLSAMAVPALLLGILAGERVMNRLPQFTFRVVVYGGLAAVGLSLVLRN